MPADVRVPSVKGRVSKEERQLHVDLAACRDQHMGNIERFSTATFGFDLDTDTLRTLVDGNDARTRTNRYALIGKGRDQEGHGLGIKLRQKRTLWHQRHGSP